MIAELKYKCCFCGERIDITEIDPCNINIAANYDKYTVEQPTQDFYCHFQCLKNTLYEDIQGYLLESNFIKD